MAKSNIKGRNVAMMVEKAEGSNTFVRVGCIGDLGLSITTESDEVTCSDSTDFKEFEPGQISIDASGNLTVRQLTDAPAGNGGVPAAQTDATDGVSTENFIDWHLAGRKLKLRFDLGQGTGTARYQALFFITKSDLKAQLKGAATYAVSLQGTGPMTKTLAP
ncbi:hypothetical protein [Hymenobacter convexus]|uniref:hypothetical protein n=1 Tax=Hymenobacter sp. CA1UV-4 TaxID=3063782 RepID=UPI002714388E|nr:hypothetical protein [Hymenobacter sp. CA1UV-4]MDO7851399.1 hypothetical protein [Hymenobacter sp. CA1UV-4]